jgi:hypothetical protein
LFGVVSEEPVRLVTSVVLGSETPIHIRKYGLLFEVNCPEDTAAYSGSPSTAIERVEKGFICL